MKESKVICDGCGENITATSNCEGWRLSLVVQSKIPQWKLEGRSHGFVTLMAVPLPLDRPKDFCGLSCLDKWRAKESAKEKAR